MSAEYDFLTHGTEKQRKDNIEPLFESTLQMSHPWLHALAGQDFNSEYKLICKSIDDLERQINQYQWQMDAGDEQIIVRICGQDITWNRPMLTTIEYMWRDAHIRHDLIPLLEEYTNRHDAYDFTNVEFLHRRTK